MVYAVYGFTVVTCWRLIQLNGSQLRGPQKTQRISTQPLSTQRAGSQLNMYQINVSHTTGSQLNYSSPNGSKHDGDNLSGSQIRLNGSKLNGSKLNGFQSAAPSVTLSPRPWVGFGRHQLPEGSCGWPRPASLTTPQTNPCWSQSAVELNQRKIKQTKIGENKKERKTENNRR